MKNIGTKLSRAFGLVIAVVLLAAAVSASAAIFAGPIVPDVCLSNAPSGSTCTICHIGVMAINLTTFLIESIAFPAAALLLAIGGIVLLTAGPSEKRILLGKTILTSTLIGLVIVALAWLAVDTIIKVLVGNPSATNFIGTLGPWNEVTIPSTGCPL